MATRPRVVDAITDEAVHALPGQFLQCRDHGHTWKAHRAQINDAERTIERSYRCASCKTVRHELLSRTDWDIIRRWYTYADGYQVPGGLVRDHKPLIRMLNTMREFPSVAGAA